MNVNHLRSYLIWNRVMVYKSFSTFINSSISAGVPETCCLVILTGAVAYELLHLWAMERSKVQNMALRM